MTVTSFLILEKKSQLIEKDRFNKYNFSKLENGFYIFYREYPNGIINNKSRLNESYLKFIKSLSKETRSIIYFLVKNTLHNEAADNISVSNYLNIKDKGSIKELNLIDVIEFNRLYKYSFKEET